MQKKIRYIAIAGLAALCVSLFLYSTLSKQYKTTDGLLDDSEIIREIETDNIKRSKDGLLRTPANRVAKTAESDTQPVKVPEYFCPT